MSTITTRSGTTHKKVKKIIRIMYFHPKNAAKLASIQLSHLLSLCKSVIVRCREGGGLEGLGVGKVISVVDYITCRCSIVGHCSVIVEANEAGVVEGYEVGVVRLFYSSCVMSVVGNSEEIDVREEKGRSV
jgi:hypothetical protein